MQIIEYNVFVYFCDIRILQISVASFRSSSRSLSFGESEKYLFTGFPSAFHPWSKMSFLFSFPNLLFSLSTRFLHRAPFKTTFDLSSWYHLKSVLLAAGLFTAALDFHRIIFGNYLRYSNSKRALPFNGQQKSMWHAVMRLYFRRPFKTWKGTRFNQARIKFKLPPLRSFCE